MTTHKTNAPAAPEIFQIPLAELPADAVPPGLLPGSPEFEQALIMHYAMQYAARGWQALVTVDAEYVRVLAIPQQGMDPKDYVFGLLENGFLEDALPILQALDGMLDDAEIAYNLGICLSELGRVAECVEPLQRCTRLDPAHANAWVGLGVAHARLGQDEEALATLSRAVELAPDNPFARRNLGAVLMKAGRHADALPQLRHAVALAPDDPAALLGLGQCLEALGGDERKEADRTYDDLVHRFPRHPLAELARQGRSRIARTRLHENVGGGVRMDAVFYMQDALERFAAMSPAQVGQVTMEIALLGRQGLEVNNPDKRYRLQNLEGDFSGLQLVSMMHVGVRQFDPKAETGSGLEKEYDLARTMARKGN